MAKAAAKQAQLKTITSTVTSAYTMNTNNSLLGQQQSQATRLQLNSYYPGDYGTF